jgi:hypothetical protein
MEKGTSSGIGIPGVLFLVFLVLKLTGNIDWSWWWVTAPIWIPIIVAIAILLILVIVFIGLLSLGYTIEEVKTKFNIKK